MCDVRHGCEGHKSVSLGVVSVSKCSGINFRPTTLAFKNNLIRSKGLNHHIYNFIGFQAISKSKCEFKHDSCWLLDKWLNVMHFSKKFLR